MTAATVRQQPIPGILAVTLCFPGTRFDAVHPNYQTLLFPAHIVTNPHCGEFDLSISSVCFLSEKRWLPREADFTPGMENR